MIAAMNPPAIYHYPFSAVIGQQSLKTALLLIAIDPKIGGILISGTRGSAKSTLARGLVDLLEQQHSPFVNLPLGVSEDRLLGSLNLEKVLANGSVEFIQGLLAQAHGGILYVDEVNLLASHLVDLLLDVSASGVNYLERDGISHQHPAEFLLVGTMNPDEGELRPQLLDRFGLCVELQDQPDANERMQIVQHRLAFDSNPAKFVEKFKADQADLRLKIQIAQQQLANIRVSTEMQAIIAARCQAANVEGVRADLALYRAARAYAALHYKHQVALDDIEAVKDFVLQHRRQASVEPSPPASPPQQSQNQPENNQPKDKQGDWGQMPVETIPIGLKRRLDPSPKKKSLKSEYAPLSGNLLHANITGSRQGKQAGIKSTRSVQWHNTLIHQDNRPKLTRLIHRPTQASPACLYIILLDTSGSMLSKQGLSYAKGILQYFCDCLYLQRDLLTVVTFGNQQVKVIMDAKPAPKSANAMLVEITGGGGTPLSDALEKVARLSQKHKSQPQQLLILTDGRVQDNNNLPKFTIPITCIDMENTEISLGKVKKLALQLNAEYLHSEQLPILE